MYWWKWKLKKKHNELVEKILTRIEMTNLYVKYKQKLREVEVVIRLDGIKIEEEKVKAVLDCIRIVNNRLNFTFFIFLIFFYGFYFTFLYFWTYMKL